MQPIVFCFVQLPRLMFIPQVLYGTASRSFPPNESTEASTRLVLMKERHHRIVNWNSPEIRAAIAEAKISCEKKLREISKNPSASVEDPFPDEILEKVQKTAKRTF